MPRASVRRWARWVHRWGGLVVGLLFVLSGLSGSALVFRRELDRALNPSLLRAAPAAATPSLARALAVAATHRPGVRFSTVRMPRESDGTYEFWHGTDPVRAVFVDPWRGAVLGERAEDAHPLGWLYLLHSHLLAGERGQQVIGVAGVLLMLVGASGLVLWWPRATWALAWQSVSQVRRDLGDARARYDLHRVVGFWSSVLLLVAGFTGTSLVFHDAFEAGLSSAFGDARRMPSAPAVVTVRGAPLSLDSLVRLAKQRQPDGAPSYILLPNTPSAPITIRQQLAGERHPNGRSFVTLDPYSGNVLAEWDAREAPAGARTYYALYPLHIGRTGGAVTRTLAVLAGITPLLLFISGTQIWWQRRRQRMTRRSR